MSTGLRQKLRTLFRDLGARDGILYLMQRLLCRLPGDPALLKYYLIAQPVTALPATTPGSTNYRFRYVEQSEYELDWFPRPTHVVHARFEQGARCLVGFDGPKAIACLWYIKGPYMEDTVRCRFTPDSATDTACAWDFDVYVLPEYRLGRAFACLWQSALLSMQQQGLSWTMSRINAFNVQSLRSHRRLGALTVGQALFFRLGRLQMTWSGTPVHAKSKHFSLSRSHVPEITVTAPAGSAPVPGRV